MRVYVASASLSAGAYDVDLRVTVTRKKDMSIDGDEVRPVPTDFPADLRDALKAWLESAEQADRLQVQPAGAGPVVLGTNWND